MLLDQFGRPIKPENKFGALETPEWVKRSTLEMFSKSMVERKVLELRESVERVNGTRV